MASYLDIKNVLKKIFRLETEMDETCDIELSSSQYINEENIVIKSIDLKIAFDKMKSFAKNELEMSSHNHLEIAVQFLSQRIPFFRELEPIHDLTNGINYSIGLSSIEYCLFILNEICESDNRDKLIAEIQFMNSHRSRYANLSSNSNQIDILPRLFKIRTFRVKSDDSISNSKLKQYIKAFEFTYMYKQARAIREYRNLEEMYFISDSILRFPRKPLDSPPQRIYNTDVLEYYTMGMESIDPFTMYISFYHVIEYYFDEVFKKHLTNEIKNKITSPDFSYKNENKLYDLAKYIKKHMNSDAESGKGNEFESLKYVLMEYVTIEDLKNKINDYKLVDTDYYENTKVPFATSKNTKISWSDTTGVVTNIATRIYETRNSLVHSKSDHAANQYKPYENKSELIKEIPLIKSVAELVIIKSSKVL
ncbi:MAG: hypothetical protein IKJ87_05660 [Ruminococcus sp.]|nr:hypothetical protein [Ruminococcus sp.]